MKVPASVADIAIAILRRLRAAGPPALGRRAPASASVHPAPDLGAWWGQYESLYVLWGLVAHILAVRAMRCRRRAGLALMTKPQALPSPCRSRRTRSGAGEGCGAPAGAAIVGIRWWPSLGPVPPDGGTRGTPKPSTTTRTDFFPVLSLRAWNLWWLVQTLLAGGSFVSDCGAARPPHVPAPGKRPDRAGNWWSSCSSFGGRRASGSYLGLAAAMLIAFSLLTTMHERYAFGALVFLAPSWSRRPVLVMWLILAGRLRRNVRRDPPTRLEGTALPVNGRLGVVGCVVMIGVTVVAVPLAASPDAADESGGRREPPAEGDEVPAQVVREPLPELEVALAGRAVAPRRRHLGEPAAVERRLHRQLEGELEPGLALDRDRIEEAPAVELEVVRGVVGRDAGEPVEGQAGARLSNRLSRGPPIWRPPRM